MQWLEVFQMSWNIFTNVQMFRVQFLKNFFLVGKGAKVKSIKTDSKNIS